MTSSVCTPDVPATPRSIQVIRADVAVMVLRCLETKLRRHGNCGPVRPEAEPKH